METRKQIVLACAVALVCGTLAALAVVVLLDHPERDTTELDARIQELESRLESEISTRKRIEQALDASSRPQEMTALTSAGDLNLRAVEQTEIFEPQTSAERNTPDPATSVSDFRKQILLNGGFTEEEANWVNQQQQEIELDNLYQQYRWRRQARENSATSARQWRGQGFTTTELRKRLGDDIYERYLRANGATTAAHVRSIVGNSPAAAAGLQADDKITAYNGQRVFNMREVSNLTLEGEEGEPILLDIEREGNTIQLSIPRGPLGVSGN